MAAIFTTRNMLCAVVFCCTGANSPVGSTTSNWRLETRTDPMTDDVMTIAITMADNDALTALIMTCLDNDFMVAIGYAYIITDEKTPIRFRLGKRQPELAFVTVSPKMLTFDTATSNKIVGQAASEKRAVFEWMVQGIGKMQPTFNISGARQVVAKLKAKCLHTSNNGAGESQ